MPSITLHITIGVIVIILWSFNFALKICQVSTGNVFAIHIFFPSREIDGAVISFIDITAQIIKVMPKLRYTLLMPVRLMSLFISSIFITTATVMTIINKQPSAQFNIYTALEVNLFNSLNSNALETFFCFSVFIL